MPYGRYETLLYRMYDKVVLNRSYPQPDLEHLRAKGVGTIVGIESRTFWTSRIHAKKHEPGKYVDNTSSFRVRFDDGTGAVLSCTAIEQVNPYVHDARQAERRANDCEDPVTAIWLEPLPELPFYELDEVMYYEWGTSSWFPATVQDINYRMLEEEGAGYPIYQLEVRNRYNIAAKASELTLVRRGNFYRLHNNEPLKFSTLDEEVKFAFIRDRLEGVKCPDTGSYAWPSLKDAMEGIKTGAMDGIYMLPNFFRRVAGGAVIPSHVQGFKLEDELLGARLRAHMMEEFTDEKLKKLAEEAGIPGPTEGSLLSGLARQRRAQDKKTSDRPVTGDPNDE